MVRDYTYGPGTRQDSKVYQTDDFRGTAAGDAVVGLGFRALCAPSDGTVTLYDAVASKAAVL